jgi:hypothetical protein
MEPDLVSLQARARRAYEAGRLWRALRTAALVAPLGLAALAPHQSGPAVCGAVSALFAAVAALSFRGRAGAEAIAPGLLAGLPALALPLGVRVLGHACGSSACFTLCLPACCVGGAIAGAALLLSARRQSDPSRKREYLAAALALAALTGSIGCAVAGVSGILGMLAATVLTSAPAWRSARAV